MPHTESSMVDIIIKSGKPLDPRDGNSIEKIESLEIKGSVVLRN